MRSELDRMDRSQPALIITYGNTSRKIRPLDRDVLMLGRANGCDVQMKSPDIFPVHLLIVRVPDGWRLRDCTGRGSTQLNGRPVQDELLRDGDVVQLSAFSFLLHLPGPRRVTAPRLVPTQSENVLDPDDAAPEAEDGSRIQRLKRSRERFAKRVLSLRRRHQEAQSLCAQLQQNLEDRDAGFAQQREVDTLLHDLKSRVKQLEQKDADLQARREALEQELLTLRQQQLAPPSPSSLPMDTDETLRRVCIRTRELESYVRHLRRLTPADQITTLEGTQKRPENELPMQQDLANLLAVVSNLQAENHLMRTRLKDWQENSQVWLTDHQKERSRSTADQEEMRQRIWELDRQLDRQVMEAERLKTQLQRQNAFQEDQEAYEAELHRFRLDLERERAAFDDQLALLQLRSQDFERSAREREEHLAQERVQFAQDRAELERLHEQLRIERERGSREISILSRSVNVQKVKEEPAETSEAFPGGPNDHSTKLPAPSKQIKTA